MMKARVKNKISIVTKATICIAGVWLCLRYAAECTRGIRNGILFCIEVLVPSLFLFMALSAYLVKSGVLLPLTKPLDGFSRRLFALPYPALAVILLSVVGGYPIGARCVAMMAQAGMLTPSQARKTIYIAVCAGPGFLINYVGRALLGCPDAGIILLAAQITGVLLTGIVIGRTVKADAAATSPLQVRKPSGSLLTTSVSDASRATFNMCGMVVLCCALIEIITAVSGDPVITDIASAVVEITTGCSLLCGRYPLYLIGFFIGFGGISVHLQIFAGIGDLAVSKRIFLLCRILQGIITAAATYILLMIFPIEVSVFNSADVTLTAAKSATLAGSAALVLCSLCFLGSITKRQLRR